MLATLIACSHAVEEEALWDVPLCKLENAPRRAPSAFGEPASTISRLREWPLAADACRGDCTKLRVAFLGTATVHGNMAHPRDTWMIRNAVRSQHSSRKILEKTLRGGSSMDVRSQIRPAKMFLSTF